MGKDLHNDNFEDFIKKNLENFDDEPSDAMWDRIAPVIPPKPSTNWESYILPTVMVLSLVLVLFLGVKMYEYKSTSETLTQELELTNSKIEALEDKVNSSENSNFNSKANSNNIENSNTSPPLNGDLNKNSAQKSENNKREKAGILNSNSTVKSNQNRTKKIANWENELNKNKTGERLNSNKKLNTNRTNENLKKNAAIPSSQNKIGTTEENEGSKPSISQIFPVNKPTKKALIPNISQDFLPKKTTEKTTVKIQNQVANPLAILDLKPIFPEVLVNIEGVKNVEKARKNAFKDGKSITLFAAPIAIKNNVRPPMNGVNPPPNFPEPQSKESIRLGKSIGLKASADLTKKLSLNVGGIYTSSSYDFNTKHRLKYNKNSEENLTMDKVSNNIDYSGSSTYGEYNIGLDITRSTNTNINQGENVEVELNATVDVNYVAVPVYLTYKLLDKNKFSAGLKGGVSYNKMMSNDLVVRDFKINKEGIEVKGFETRKPPKPTQKSTLNYISGIVLEYELANNWSLNVEPTWSAALSDNHRDSFGRTKSNTFSLDVGVKYRF